MLSRREWTLRVGVLLLAIALRVGFALLFSDTLDFVASGTIHGSEAYDTYAQNLLDTGVYGRTPGVPDADIPPLYSYVLAGVYGLLGRSFVSLALLNIALDAASLWMLFAIGRRTFRAGSLWGLPVGEWAGLLAGVFYAAYPYLLFQNLTVIDTPLWMALLHAYVLLMLVLRERPLDRWTALWIIVAGVVLGLSLLVRPLLPLFAVLAALWFLFRRSLGQTLLRLAPVALVGALVVLPWVLRNGALYDDFVPMTTTSGANFWQGNSEWTVPVLRAGYDVQWTSPEIDPTLPPNEADSERFRLGIEYLQQHPERIPELWWTKFLVQWSIRITPLRNPEYGEQWALNEAGELDVLPSDESITGVTESNTAYNEGLLDRVGRPVHMLYFGSLLLLALVGMAGSVRQWREVSLLWFVQLSMTVMYVLFHPSTRYRAPTDPLLFLFSAYALLRLVQWWRRRGQPSSA